MSAEQISSALGDSPVLGDSPAFDDYPILGDSPVLGDSPALDDYPILGDSPVLSDSPVLGNSPALDDYPILGDSPIIGDSPVIGDGVQIVPLKDDTIDVGRRMPTMSSANDVEPYDWHRRANNVEDELLTERSARVREERRNLRLRTRLRETAEKWTTCSQTCQALARLNYNYSQELQRYKFKVETLETLVKELF